jgi:hypothetical protein
MAASTDYTKPAHTPIKNWDFLYVCVVYNMDIGDLENLPVASTVPREFLEPSGAFKSGCAIILSEPFPYYQLLPQRT